MEIGWTYEGSYDDAVGTSVYRAKAATPLAAFPCLREMLSRVMHMLDASLPLDEERLNVSCLLYEAGQFIPWHADRPYVYRDAVFGCVVFNSSDSALEFHSTDKRGRPTERYLIDEAISPLGFAFSFLFI